MLEDHNPNNTIIHSADIKVFLPTIEYSVDTIRRELLDGEEYSFEMPLRFCHKKFLGNRNLFFQLSNLDIQKAAYSIDNNDESSTRLFVQAFNICEQNLSTLPIVIHSFCSLYLLFISLSFEYPRINCYISVKLIIGVILP